MFLRRIDQTTLFRPYFSPETISVTYPGFRRGYEPQNTHSPDFQTRINTQSCNKTHQTKRHSGSPLTHTNDPLALFKFSIGDSSLRPSRTRSTPASGCYKQGANQPLIRYPRNPGVERELLYHGYPDQRISNSFSDEKPPSVASSWMAKSEMAVPDGTSKNMNPELFSPGS